jgi:hypothetical protein
VRDLNEWERALMDTLASGDLTPVDAVVAAFAALGAAGRYAVDTSCYRPIREYIAGSGGDDREDPLTGTPPRGRCGSGPVANPLRGARRRI